MNGYLLIVAAALTGMWWFLWELPARRSARRAVDGIRAQAKAWVAEEAYNERRRVEDAP